MMELKFPGITVPLSGENGNAYAILGRVQKAMWRAKVPQEDIDAFLAEAESGDYDHLLQTVMRTVYTT